MLTIVVSLCVQFNVVFELVASITIECPDGASGTPQTAFGANFSAIYTANVTSTAADITNISTTALPTSATSSLGQECENQVCIPVCVRGLAGAMGVVHTIYRSCRHRHKFAASSPRGYGSSWTYVSLFVIGWR